MDSTLVAIRRKIGRSVKKLGESLVAVGWRVEVGGVVFWVRIWVLNEETSELGREEQKKRATCKSTLFPAIFSFFKRGAQENSSEL